MNAGLVELLLERIRGQSDEELLSFWMSNDRRNYSPEAFEAARTVLLERGIDPPPQPPPRTPAVTAEVVDEDWLRVLKVVLYIGLALGITSLAGALVQYASHWESHFTSPGRWAVLAYYEMVMEHALPALLILSAVGGLKRSPLGRQFLLIYAWITIGLSAIYLVSRLYRTFQDGLRGPAEDLAWTVYFLRYAVAAALYPLIVLVLITRPPVRELFKRPARGFEAGLLRPAGMDRAGAEIGHE